MNADFQLESNLASCVPKNFYSQLPPPLSTPKAIFTLYGRNALYGVSLQIIKHRPQKREILVPSYSCGDEIESLVEAGFIPITYPVHSNLEIDPHGLERCITSKTSAILITHYFGFPQSNTSQIKKLCEANNLFLIEDCAQALGGTLDNQSLGTFGHVSIFSLRKFLPIPHGGALLINSPEIPCPQFQPPSNQASSFDLFLYLGMLQNLFPPSTPISDIYSSMNTFMPSLHGPRLPKEGGYKLSISNIAKFLVSKISFSEIAAARRRRFLFLLEFFNYYYPDLIVKSALEKNIVPLNFPILVSDSSKVADVGYQKGLKNIQPFWNYLHKYVKWNKYKDARSLKSRILAISLNHDFSSSQLDTFLEILSHNK